MKKANKLTKITLAIATTLFASSASANIEWSGFGSFKAGSTLSSDKNAFGYDSDLNFKNESLFALQARSDVSENVSVTAQVMARGAEDFNVELEWAYMTYRVTGNTSINVGRQRTAFYQYSDFLDLGFAYDWVRTPQVVYDLGYDSIDGVSLNHRFDLGGWEMDARAMLGTHSGTNNVAGYDIKQSVDNMYGGSLSARNGSFETRLAHFRGDLSFTNDDLLTLGQWLQLGGFDEIGSAFEIVDKSANFTGFGVFYDNGRHVLNSEITRVEAKDSIIPKINTYYVSYGYRFDSLTPYVMYENRENKHRDGLLEGLDPTNPLIAAASDVINTFGQKQDIYSVGFRKNLSNRLAFKSQFSYIEDRLNGNYDQVASISFDVIF